MEYLNSTDIEIGFKILNYIIFYATNGKYIVMQVLGAVIPFLFIYLGLKSYQKFCNIEIVVFLFISNIYFQVMSTGMIRMFIAVGIIFYAIKYIPERKPFKYLGFIILAMSFHISSGIMLLFMFFFIDDRRNFIKKNWKKFLFLCIFVLPVAFIIIGKYLVPIMGDRYAIYSSVNRIKILLKDFDTLPFFIWGLYCKPIVDDKDRDIYTIGLCMIALSCVVSVLSSMVNLGRLIYITNIGMVIVLGILCKTNKKKNNILTCITYILVIIYGCIYLNTTQIRIESHYKHLFPYKNLFFEI